MEADWTGFSPPAQNQHRPTRRWPRPAAITKGKAVRGHKMLIASCAGFVNGGEIPGCGIYRSAGRLEDEDGAVNEAQ